MKVLDLDPSPALSIQKNMKKTLQGRKVGILYADGSDGAEIEAVQKAIKKDGATVFLVAPKVGGAKLKNGTVLRASLPARRRSCSTPSLSSCPTMGARRLSMRPALFSSSWMHSDI